MIGGPLLEWIDMESRANEELKQIDEMDLLTPESKKIFLKWCDHIRVPKRTGDLDPLILKYQNEREYRKQRDEEHQFADLLERSILWNSKIQFRKNEAVLPIEVSAKQANRGFRIVNSLINSIRELKGTVVVEPREEDNAYLTVFNQTFTFKMIETKAKRRSLFSNGSLANVKVGLNPMYEQVYTGMLEIKITEKLNYRERDKTPETVLFTESSEKPIEDQMGEIFIALLRMANRTCVDRFIAEREYEKSRQEKLRLQEIEEEKRKVQLRIEGQKQLKQKLIQNIENQMNNWFKSQELRKYAGQLEEYASKLSDDTNKKLLYTYIQLVHQKADSCDPVTEILTEIKDIELNNIDGNNV
ncbi:MAG: hypothetical protein E6230_24950 [Paenibacillus dendritiformis]|uniref:hypothetical protein n=1 Tax=uncultured Paenibacillus sp. TaxID=227322 RepID=UPI0025FFC937|nr:hypothetical protein [uncultured Paenibacillus sp.]MDU5145429.1 hypothetical protein [Paenibacillus dendritiformis]